MHVTIDFKSMRDPIESRKIGEDFKKADYFGEILTEDQETHYTKIFLTSIREGARKIMSGAISQSETGKVKSLYGLKFETIARILSRDSIVSWKDFDEYSETMLEVALNIPVRYADGWISSTLETPLIVKMEKEIHRLDFCVSYDATELRKPIVHYAHDKKEMLTDFEYNGDLVSARGYFYALHGTIKPRELQGLLLRIRNAAVGDFDSTFWGFPPTEFSLIQRWVSAEIWASDELEDAMNIDRRTLRVAHPAFVELRVAVHKKLRAVLREAQSQLYVEQRDIRRVEKADEIREDILRFSSEELKEVAPKASKVIERSLSVSENNDALSKILLKKYTVSDLYKLIIEVARDSLSDENVDIFMEKLTERITR